MDAARAGTAPTEFLFGAIELGSSGHEIEQYEVDPAAPASRVARRLVDGNAGRGHLAPHLSAAVLAGTRRLLPELRSADVILCEDTRHTRVLLDRHGISGAKLLSYHEHNEAKRTAELLPRL